MTGPTFKHEGGMGRDAIPHDALGLGLGLALAAAGLMP